MRNIIILISVLSLFSCAEDCDNEDSKEVEIQVDESDILGVWHYHHVKYFNSQDTVEFDLKDTIDFQENGNAIWFGYSNIEKYRFALNFYDEYADWFFIKKQNYIYFAGNYSLYKIIGVKYAFMTTNISGTITKFEDGKMTVNSDESPNAFGYANSEFQLYKLSKDSTSN